MELGHGFLVYAVIDRGRGKREVKYSTAFVLMTIASARPEMGWSGDLIVHTAANCR